MTPPAEPADVAAVAAQLGREPRAIHEIGHRCPCGNPDVVTTLPRLPNGTPFPTTYYLTCPRAASRIGTLEFKDGAPSATTVETGLDNPWSGCLPQQLRRRLHPRHPAGASQHRGR